MIRSVQFVCLSPCHRNTYLKTNLMKEQEDNRWKAGFEI